MRYFLLFLGTWLVFFPVSAFPNNLPVGKFAYAGETKEPEKINSGWGKMLNPSGNTPNTGFHAIYFDRSNPEADVFHENVESISIQYLTNDFQNIESETFAAYWVGKLNFEEATSKQISVSQDGGKSRILIDGNVVLDGPSDREIVYDFSQGEHIIEVEYINEWHTVEYKVTIQDKVLPMSEDDIASYFKNKKVGNSSLYYVGLYESSAKDMGVDVSLPITGSPIILWLSSNQAIDWNISSVDEISAVVISSYSPRSRVTGVKAAHIMHLDDWDGIYREGKRCTCSAGNFHCESNSDLQDIALEISSITNRKLTGYAVQINAEAVTTQAYNQSVIKRIQEYRAENFAAQQKCASETKPPPRAIMENW